MDNNQTTVAFDIGVVVSDGEKALEFYRDVLGLVYESGVPIYDGAMYHKLMCGASTVKVIAPVAAPAICSAPGPGRSGLGLEDMVRAVVRGAGFRSLTIYVSDIQRVVARCAAGGFSLVVPLHEQSHAPGTFMAMVEDPDGNWIELLTPSKAAVDVGVVVRDAEKSLRFYRDTLGLTYDTGVPISDGAMLHKLTSGASVMMMLAPVTAPEICSAPGLGQSGLELDDTMRAIMRTAGFRYLTVHVTDINEVVAQCAVGGYSMVVPLQELTFAPGTLMALVEDPDGNWVELLQDA